MSGGDGNSSSICVEFDADDKVGDHRRGLRCKSDGDLPHGDEISMKFMKFLLAMAMILTTFAFGCGDDSSESDNNANNTSNNANNQNNANNVDGRVSQVAALQGDASAGQPQFEAICVTCHATDGTGVDGLGNDLTVSTLSQVEVIDTIINGRGQMVGYDTSLEDQEVADIAAYTLQFRQ